MRFWRMLLGIAMFLTWRRASARGRLSVRRREDANAALRPRRNIGGKLLGNRGIDFKHRRGLPSAALTGYEWQRWLDVHGPNTW